MTGRRIEEALADDGPILLPPTHDTAHETADDTSGEVAEKAGPEPGAPAAPVEPRNKTITITVPRFWARPRPRPATASAPDRVSGRHAHPVGRTPGRSHRIGLGAVALAAVVAVSLAGDSPLIHTELDSHRTGTGSTDSQAETAFTQDASPGNTPPEPAAGAPVVSIPGGPTVSPAPTRSPDPRAVALPAAAPRSQLPVAPKVGESSASQQLSSSGIPARARTAYTTAAAQMASVAPGCKLPWSLLAAIGRVESNHGRYGGSRLIASTGRAHPAVLGVRLDGTAAGTSVIRDSDRGTLDGDDQYDRAVGPMQFLPATWRAVAVDADGDGAANPQDLDDAALAAGRYLCTGTTAATDLSTPTGQWSAAYRYNRSSSYADLVLALSTTYATGKPATVVNQPKGATTAVPTVTLTVTPVPAPATSAGTIPTTTATVPPSTTVTATQTSTGGTTVTTTVTAAPTTSSSTAGPVVTVTVTVVTVTVTGQPGTSTTTSTGQ